MNKDRKFFWWMVVGFFLVVITGGSLLDFVPGDETIAAVIDAVCFIAFIIDIVRTSRIKQLPPPASASAQSQLPPSSSAGQHSNSGGPTMTGQVFTDDQGQPGTGSGQVPPIHIHVDGTGGPQADVTGILNLIVTQHGAHQRTLAELAQTTASAQKYQAAAGGLAMVMLNPTLPVDQRVHYVEKAFSSMADDQLPETVAAMQQFVQNMGAGAGATAAAKPAKKMGPIAKFWQNFEKWKTWQKVVFGFTATIGLIITIGGILLFGFRVAMQSPQPTSLPSVGNNAGGGYKLSTGGETNKPPVVATEDIVVYYAPADGVGNQSDLFNLVAEKTGYAQTQTGPYPECIWAWILGQETDMTRQLGVSPSSETRKFSGFNAWENGGHGSATITIPAALLNACGGR